MFFDMETQTEVDRSKIELPGGIQQPGLDTLARHGFYRVRPEDAPTPDGMEWAGWAYEFDGHTAIRRPVFDSIADRLAREAAAEAARLAGLAQVYAPLVALINKHLALAGHSVLGQVWAIPCSAAAVAMDVAARDAAGTLTAAQRASAQSAAQYREMLLTAGLTDQDIADISTMIPPPA